jgi:hypothetical protein
MIFELLIGANVGWTLGGNLMDVQVLTDQQDRKVGWMRCQFGWCPAAQVLDRSARLVDPVCGCEKVVWQEVISQSQNVAASWCSCAPPSTYIRPVSLTHLYAPASTPLTAFRDSLLAHLNSLPPTPTSDAIIAKLVLAGSQLELLKYAEQFYELIILGGLLQPGGSYLDNERCRFSVWACGKTEGLGWELNENEEEGGEKKGDWKKQVRELVEVLKKVIQRFVVRGQF